MNRTTVFKKAGLSYGWLIVATSALLMSGFWGSMGSFGVFLKPLIAEFGWTRALASGAMSIMQLVYGFVAIVMGRLTDKYGTRIILAFGAVTGVLGYLLMSRVSSIWQLYIFLGVLIGVCIGTSWAPVNATVSKWFVKQRVLALSIVTLGPAIGHMLVPPFSAWLIEGYSLSVAYTTLAIIVFVTSFPAVLVLGKKPPDPIGSSTGVDNNKVNSSEGNGDAAQQRQWTAGEAIRSVPLRMLMIFTFINAIVFFFFSVHIVAYATDMGITTTSAALILTIFNGISIVGIFFAWPISAKLGSRGALLLLLGLQAVALFLFIRAESLWAFLVLSAVFGFGFGGTNPLRAEMVPHMFGTRSVGTILGFIAFSWSLGGVIGPFAAAYIYDFSRSYDIAFLSAGLLTIIAIVAIYNLGGRKKEQ